MWPQCTRPVPGVGSDGPSLSWSQTFRYSSSPPAAGTSGGENTRETSIYWALCTHILYCAQLRTSVASSIFTCPRWDYVSEHLTGYYNFPLHWCVQCPALGPVSDIKLAASHNKLSSCCCWWLGWTGWWRVSEYKIRGGDARAIGWRCWVRIGDTSCLLAMIPSQISSGQSVSVTSKYSQPGHRALSIHHILLISYFPFIVTYLQAITVFGFTHTGWNSVTAYFGKNIFGFGNFALRNCTLPWFGQPRGRIATCSRGWCDNITSSL